MKSAPFPTKLSDLIGSLNCALTSPCFGFLMASEGILGCGCRKYVTSVICRSKRQAIRIPAPFFTIIAHCTNLLFGWSCNYLLQFRSQASGPLYAVSSSTERSGVGNTNKVGYTRHSSAPGSLWIMDGLSAAASVFAVLDISAKIIGACRKYFLEVKSGKEDIIRLRNEVMSLQDVLNKIGDMSEADEGTTNKAPIFNTLTKKMVLYSIVSTTWKILPRSWTFKEKKGRWINSDPELWCGLSVVEILIKFSLSSEGTKWRWDSSSLAILCESCRASRSQAFSYQLLRFLPNNGVNSLTNTDVEPSGLTRAIHNDVVDIRIGQKSLLADSKYQNLRSWLNPPDPSSNHNAAWQESPTDNGNLVLSGGGVQRLEICSELIHLEYVSILLLLLK